MRAERQLTPTSRSNIESTSSTFCEYLLVKKARSDCVRCGLLARDKATMPAIFPGLSGFMEN
jgi:hypothetical protein